MQPKKLLMNWKKLFKILIFILFLAFLFLWLRSGFWKVKEVKCQFNQLNCNQEIEKKLEELSVGENVLFFPSTKIIKKIKENYPQISLVKIKKQIPQRIFFEMTSRKPVVAFSNELFSENEADSSDLEEPQFVSSGDYYLVDDQGMVIQKIEEKQNFPLILLKKDFQLNIGQQISQPEILKAIEIVSGMRLRLLEPKVALPLSLREIKVWLEGGLLTNFNGEKDIQVQLDSLQFIYSRSKIEGKKIKKIDLRFEKPVVVFN